ncbi:hypothetical protein BJY00DRAFT_311293 [Aspergillus carlsbadensis]|nr:hypothetical protein BJY00DRAFT_311293 [Aspergillus carlsbadensis]
MAELAALGLACNIIQLVDFGSNLFSKAREIAHSAHGVGDEENELEAIARDLKSLLHNLKDDPAGDSTFDELRQACCGVGNELVSVIEDLKSQNIQGWKWGSFKQAVRLVRKEKEIRALERRLGKLQAQISTHLITTLSSKHSSTIAYIQRLNENTTRLEMNTTQSIETLRLELLDVLKQRPKESSASPLATAGIKLAEFSRQGLSLEKQQEILGSLSFNDMHWRYSSTKKEHEKTFEWIFKNPDTKFIEWLKTGDGIYWIEGKAGSGKSTLMKYLVRSAHTHTALKEWAGDCQLSTASYFIWSPGEHMQRSREGLLRTILFQVLRSYPDLVPSVCPERWHGDSAPYFGDWDYEELVRTLDLVAKGTFRPWNVFVNAFDGKVPQLKLETLTKGDIQKYVDDRLDIRTLAADQDAESRREMVEEIEEGDDLSDMRRRLDSLPDDLEEFFKRMLSSIDKVYREQTARIFLVMVDADNSLPLLAFHCLEQEQSDEQYALTAEAGGLSEFEMKQLSEKMKIRLNARCRDLLETTMHPEAEWFNQYRIGFLQRTVRDFFLETTAIDDIMKPETSAGFDPLLSLCRIMLALVKTIPPGGYEHLVNAMRHQVMVYASRLEARPLHEHKPQEQFCLLDELERTWIKGFLRGCIETGLVSYLRHRLVLEPKLLQGPGSQSSLLYALHGFIDALSPRRSDGQKHASFEMPKFLLEEQRLDPNARDNSQTTWILCLEMVAEGYLKREPHTGQIMCDAIKLFLKNGADPNARRSLLVDRRPAISILRDLFPHEAAHFEVLAANTNRRSLALSVSDREPRRKRSPMRTLLDRFL